MMSVGFSSFFPSFCAKSRRVFKQEDIYSQDKMSMLAFL
jgi:hypothetical protein